MWLFIRSLKMAGRLVAPVSQALKNTLAKIKTDSNGPQTIAELKKSGPATGLAIDQLESSLAELDTLAVFNGIDYKKPIDQYLQWDLLEKESEPYMPGLAREIRKLSLDGDALPFVPDLNAIRIPFEDKVAELVRCQIHTESDAICVFTFFLSIWAPVCAVARSFCGSF